MSYTVRKNSAGELVDEGDATRLVFRKVGLADLPDVLSLFPREDRIARRDRLVLDLSQLRLAYPSFVAPLCAWFRKEWAHLSGKRLEIEPPEEAAVDGWLRDSGFYAQLDARFSGASRQRTMSLVRIAPEEPDAPLEVAKNLDALLTENHIAISDDALHSLETAVSEISENALRHGRLTSEAFACAQVYPGARKVAISVADCGIGIEQSFREAIYIPARERLLRGDSYLDLALEPLMSSKHGHGHSGYGLFYTSELCAQSSGTFMLTSGGRSVVTYGNSRKFEHHTDWCGTIVSMLMDTTQPIDGRRVWDRLPSAIEDDFLTPLAVGRPSFELSSVGTRLYTREAAGKALASLIAHPSQSFHIGFDRVLVMTPSFADEFFGALFERLGESDYVRRVRLVDADPYMQYLVEMVIKHRREKSLSLSRP